MSLATTLTMEYVPTSLSTESRHYAWKGKSMVDAGGSIVSVGECIIAMKGEYYCIGRIIEILQFHETDAIVLLSSYTCNDVSQIYGLPRLQPSAWLTVAAKVRWCFYMR